ncbi:MAG TPA: sulfate reduction electron transfer complex DsrMKJOP subunit DsrJ [Dissulfurispiraceae bacterium]|nr:sulfate reduction electron transfer complex DsrMKJOP subunit DsrJ [Dissulfurispiraceae bacterium]
MYDGGKIVILILVLIGLVTFPIYYNAGKAAAKPDPKIDTPVIQQMQVKKCIEPKEFMKAEHMQILDDWRDAVVRNGETVYVASDGQKYPMSLQNTCMRCHSNKDKFCDECHTYVAVKPYCWDCHIEPKKGDAKPVATAPAPAGPPPTAVLHFAVGKVDPEGGAEKMLVPIVEYLKANPQATVDISGYVDKTGDPKKNEELAKNRAKAVRDMLTAAGVPLDRIGMKKPEVITGAGSDVEARRVEVSIAGGKGV